MKFDSLILKTHLSYCEGSQKCIVHSLYASTITLSDYFVTEQQQTVRDGATKSDEFSEKFQTAYDIPPLIFVKLCCKFFWKTSEKALYKGPVRFGGAICSLLFAEGYLEILEVVWKISIGNDFFIKSVSEHI